MKGTLFSSDFVVDSNGGLRLIEINTDTAIQDSLAATQLDWAGLLSTLSTNSISELHVIYKNVQKSIVDNLEEAVQASGQSISFNRVIEADNSIYPTVVEDSESKFILRLAFDEGAVLDSNYAANDLNLYKLFVDANANGSIPGFYHNDIDSGVVLNTLENKTNSNNIADLAVRKVAADKGRDLSFYKLGNTSADDSTRIASAISELGTSGDILTNYYVPAGASKASSIRFYSVVYGDNLDVVTVGNYKIEAILDFPTSLDVDLSNDVTKIPGKHFSEFSVEGINRTGGILANHSLVRVDGGADLAPNTIIGDQYVSYFISGSPDTDQYGTLFQWSHAGDTMPEGSQQVSSIMLSSTSHNSVNQTTIKITLANGDVLNVAALTNIVVYQAATDSIRYIYASSLTTNDSLFDSNGQKVGISSLEVEIHDTQEESTTYEYNLEDTDIFTVSGSNIIVHNAPCFVAGTKINTTGGTVKNIEDVLPGDLVATVDHTDGAFVAERKHVLEVMKKEGQKVVTYKFANGLELTGTPDHPLYVEGKGYSSLDPALTLSDSGFKVGQIVKGDKVWHEEGACIEIVDIVDNGETATVYNLKNVEDNHNFYANGFLVHNRYK